MKKTSKKKAAKKKAEPAAKKKAPAAKKKAPTAKKMAAPAAKKKAPTAKKKAAPAANTAPSAPAAGVGAGTRLDPWQLQTANLGSSYLMYREPDASPPALVCLVGSTELRYHLRCIDDTAAMLRAHGDWMPLGGADEQKPAADGTVEAWGRAPSNPVGGWYGLRKGYRGRFGMYVPPLLERLGLVELEHNPKNNRVRARG
jgi:hypothetical protein